MRADLLFLSLRAVELVVVLMEAESVARQEAMPPGVFVAPAIDNSEGRPVSIMAVVKRPVESVVRARRPRLAGEPLRSSFGKRVAGW